LGVQRFTLFAPQNATQAVSLAATLLELLIHGSSSSTVAGSKQGHFTLACNAPHACNAVMAHVTVPLVALNTEKTPDIRVAYNAARRAEPAV
jgi:hypothetical protein